MYGVKGKELAGERQQDFSLVRDGQTIVQGSFKYREYEVKRGLPPMLGVDVVDGNHIYTNVKLLLDDEMKEWWIVKAFRTTNQDNEGLKQKQWI